MATTNTNKHWALQRKLLMNTRTGFNAEVYRHFKDVVDSDTAASNSRKTLRDSLLINLKDSRTTAMFKVQYFREQVQKVHHKPAVIGIPKEQFDVGIEIEYRPIVQLYFQQDKAATSPQIAPVTAEISFRLMNETEATLTQQNIETLARTIKNEFAISPGYTFNKGKILATYIDKKFGYFLQLYVVNETEGIEVVRKILNIQNHAYDEDKFRITMPKRNSLNNPANTVVAGKTYRKPRWRPTATVRFQWASLLFNANPDPIYLVDRTFSRPAPIELVAA